jgi:hypothetical protein
MRSKIGATTPPNQMAALVRVGPGFSKRQRDYNRIQELRYYMVRLSLLGIDGNILYNIREKTFSSHFQYYLYHWTKSYYNRIV